jgi:hypothetical protein
MGIHPEIRQVVEAVRVIDTHEPLEEEHKRLNSTLDFAAMFGPYASDDLAAAGLPAHQRERVFAPETPVDEKWTAFEPYYRAARNTAYCKAVEIAMRDLYGIRALDADTVGQLSERIAERNKPGVLRWILQERSGVERAHVNALDTLFFRRQTDRSLFRQDLSIVQLLNWPIPMADLERETGVAIDGFGGYGKAIDALFALHGPHAVAVKQQSAYWRAQDFEDVADADAQIAFERTARDAESVSEADRKKLQDWGFHRCLRRAVDHGLVIKIHTGYKVGNDYMDMNHIRATPLFKVFMQYPRARFDLFHIGYPYEHEVIALAKHFANVYVDMCWAWIIDPVAAAHFLRRFLTAVPASKLFAFGGDSTVAEPVYGHLRIARADIARVLSTMVAAEQLDVAEAKTIAERILRENALEVFGA